MDVQPEVMDLESGRRVGVYHGGNREARRTVVYAHIAPGSGAFDPDPAETARRDVHLIALDRPGYGASEAMPPEAWATVASAAEDIAEILRGLDIGTVGVAGWSAGGRVALALAASHPDLVDRVAVIGTPAPDEAVPWMADEERAGIAAMRGMPLDQARSVLRGQMSQAFPNGVTEEVWSMMLAASAADAAELQDPAASARLGGMMRQAFTQGLDGMVDDVLGYTLQPWGFEPDDVDAPTLLLYGGSDPVAGSAHGRWWQQHLPHARLEMAPGAGHLLVVPQWGRVLSHLAPGTLTDTR
jgi:pimeloyl-ACP methyl ester carboxylesterase